MQHSGENGTKRKQVTFLDWRLYSKLTVLSVFLTFQPQIDIHLHDTNLINNRVTTAICKTLNIVIPKRTVTVSNSRVVVNPKIVNLKNRKSKAFKKWSGNRTISNHHELTKISKELNHEIRKARNKRIQNTVGKGQKQFWSFVKTLTKSQRSGGISLLMNGLMIHDPPTLCESFANFFLNKVLHLSESSNPSNFVIPDIFSCPTRECEFITGDVLRNVLRSCKPSKAQGLDEIPSLVIKHITEPLIDPLLWLFNNIMLTCSYPKAWKIAKVLPLHKSGELTSITNYRPISHHSTTKQKVS